MAVRPPRFETQFVGLTQTPVDLSAVAAILPDGPSDRPLATGLGELPYRFVDVFAQLTSGSARWVEATQAPTADGDGHVMGAGDGVLLRLERGAADVVLVADGYLAPCRLSGERIADP